MHKKISVEGMSCNHCKASVESALKEIEGINLASVKLDEKKVEIDYDENKVSLNKIQNIINDLGFIVKND